jgi:hypothetical protein
MTRKATYAIRGDLVRVVTDGQPDEHALRAHIAAALGRDVELRFSHEVEPDERRRPKGRVFWYTIHEVTRR